MRHNPTPGVHVRIGEYGLGAIPMSRKPARAMRMQSALSLTGLKHYVEDGEAVGTDTNLRELANRVRLTR